MTQLVVFGKGIPGLKTEKIPRMESSPALKTEKLKN